MSGSGKLSSRKVSSCVLCDGLGAPALQCGERDEVEYASRVELKSAAACSQNDAAADAGSEGGSALLESHCNTAVRLYTCV